MWEKPRILEFQTCNMYHELCLVPLPSMVLCFYLSNYCFARVVVRHGLFGRREEFFDICVS